MKINKVLGLAATATLVMACTQTPTANRARSNSKLQVDYAVLKGDTLPNSIRITGSLIPAESAMLSAQASGQVREIFFDEGQRVAKNQLLLKLDERQWLAQKQKLEAQLATAKRDAERKKQLADINGISQAALDEAELSISTIEADIQELDVLIDYAAIRAPFAGQIGLRSVSPGSYISAGDPVARLVKLDILKLEFSVPERYAPAIKIGQSLQFTVAGTQSTYSGTVYAMEPAISETSRTLKVRAEVPNKSRLILAGAFADITLTLDTIFNALLLPTEAIVPKLNSQIVYQVKDGKIQERTVQTGVRLPRLIQIEEGLNSGDTIIVSGLLQAKPGLSVAPTKQITLNRSEEQ